MADFFGERTLSQPIDPNIDQEVTTDPLALDIDDKDLVENINKLIDDSRRFFKKHNVYQRREKNLEYYLGLQIQHLMDKGELTEKDPQYSDNVIWEAEANLKPIALSRIPDLLVTPANDTPDSKTSASELTDIINSDLRKRENRWVLGRTYKHRPIYFIGAIKYLWDPELDDYRFENIHPDNVDVDHMAPDNDSRKMRWIAHHYKLTAKEVTIRFESAKDEFMQKFKEKHNVEPQSKVSEKGMMTPVTISEVWFNWYKKRQDKWEKIWGVIWKYDDVVLKKMKNPNWDWEGEQELFTYNDDGEKQGMAEDAIREATLTGVLPGNIQSERVFSNYLKQPEHPFIFIGYDQLGRMPYDETTRIEQVRVLQDNIDKRGKQITTIADNALGKNVFSTDSGLTAEDIEKIDMRDPDQDILVKGDIRSVWTLIPGQQPSAALFQELDQNRNIAFAKMGAHATTRGEKRSDVATTNQILRESDFTKQDDEVSETINYAAERMAQAALQMIKLRYTEDKIKKLVGDKGQIVFKTINQDMVEDGMEVEVTASAVDKLRRKSEALEMARLKMIDPLSFFEDTEVADPKGRAERLMIFNLSPELYMQQVVQEKTTADMATDLQNQPVNGETPPAAPPAAPGAAAGAQDAMAVIAALQSGQTPEMPAQPDAALIQAVSDFISSPEFQALDPAIQQNAVNFANDMITRSQGEAPAQAATATAV